LAAAAFEAMPTAFCRRMLIYSFSMKNNYDAIEKYLAWRKQGVKGLKNLKIEKTAYPKPL